MLRPPPEIYNHKRGWQCQSSFLSFLIEISFKFKSLLAGWLAGWLCQSSFLSFPIEISFKFKSWLAGWLPGCAKAVSFIFQLKFLGWLAGWAKEVSFLFQFKFHSNSNESNGLASQPRSQLDTPAISQLASQPASS